jgi:hypothetical protein
VACDNLQALELFKGCNVRSIGCNILERQCDGSARPSQTKGGARKQRDGRAIQRKDGRAHGTIVSQGNSYTNEPGFPFVRFGALLAPLALLCYLEENTICCIL